MNIERTATHGLRSLERLAGGGLLAATGAIHLDLYLTGYRSIPTIGWLFLLQVASAFGLAALIVVTHSRLAAGAGALFSLSTLGGYLLSIWVGLFGFKEVRTTAGIAAGAIEVAAFAMLAAVTVDPGGRLRTISALPSPHGDRLRSRVRQLEWAVAGMSLVALALLGIAFASAYAPGSNAPAGRPKLDTRHVGGAVVLTNAKGFTLYWFSRDDQTQSRCNGSCAAYWPPVIGTPKAGRGVTGRLGTVRRSDGSIQATYDRHPLYTYIADAAPDQARGNSLNLNGGLWHEVTVSHG